MFYNYDDEYTSDENSEELKSEKSGFISDGYYEPWEDHASLDDTFSPNYHDTASLRFAQPRYAEPKPEKKSGGFGKFMRAVCLVVACGLVSGLTASVVTEKKLEKADLTVKNEVILGPVSSDTDEETERIYVPSSDGQMAPEAIYELACKQVVGIQISATGYNIFGQKTTTTPVVGSGFIVSSDGYIVTNFHVIESYVVHGPSKGYSLSVIVNDGSAYDAEIIGYDNTNDIAVLKIGANNLTPVTIGNMSGMNVGSTVYAVGNPLGELEYTMTDGIISALDRVISTEVSTSINVFQFNAAVNSGNSGGPVYNANGEVIGVVDAKYKASGVEGLGFAIPIDDAMNIIKDLIEHGYVTGKAYLGIYARTVSSSVAMFYGLTEGAFVDSVAPGAAADKAGILPGDIITAVGDDAVLSKEDLQAAKSAYSAGDTAEFTINRNGETLKVTVTFDEQPADVGNYILGDNMGAIN